MPDICHPANIDETEYPAESPSDYARRMAKSKAEAIRSEFSKHIILSGDTAVAVGVVFCQRQRMRRLQKTVRHVFPAAVTVFMGLCLITPDGVTRCRLSVSMVKFKQLSQNELNAYLEGGEWDGKAGGYAIQGQAEQLISMISGSHANIMGFDVHLISGMLGAIGFCHQP